MKNVLITTLAFGCFAAQPLFAQRAEPTNSLARARAVFDLADANKDGKLDFEELSKQRLPIKKSEFDAMDADKSASWSRDEFLVYYRRLLLSNRQRPSAELESEVTRVEATRKAKEAETKRNAVPSAAGVATATSVDDRLQLAIDELELKAAQRQATRAEFQHVRDLMIERSKAAQAATDAPDLHVRFDQAMTALETKAKAGDYSREDFNALRALLIQHARAATDATTDVDAKLQIALDELEKKAALRQATRADFDGVRDAWTARAQAATFHDPVADADLKTKFEAAMSALEVQAKQGNYSREEYNALRDQYIARGRNAANQSAMAPAGDPDAQLQSALDDLDRKAQAHQATHADFVRVSEASTARAKAASVGVDPTVAAQDAALAQKFQVAMDELEKEALAGTWSREKFEAVRQSYIHRARAASNGTAAAAPGELASDQKRLDEALATLETRALARGATREDYQRVKDLLVAHARESVKAADGVSPAAADDPRVTALATKLGAAIDQIEEQARAGKITRADFENLRQMFIHRARAAANPGTVESPVPDNPVKPTGPGSRAQTPKPADGGTTATRGPAEGRRAEQGTPTPPAPAPTPTDKPKPDGSPSGEKPKPENGSSGDKPKPDDGSSGREKPPPHRG